MNNRAVDIMAQWEKSATIGDIISFKENHRKQFLGDYHGYVKIFEGAFEVAAQTVEALNYAPKTDWPKHRSSQYPFFPNMLETLYRANDDFMDGFYDEANMLNRSVFESIIRVIWASCNKEHHNTIWTKKEKGAPEFNVSNFLKHDLIVDWDYIWGYSSMATHGKRHRVLFLLMDLVRGKPRSVSWNLKYDKHLVTHPMNISTDMLWLILRLLRTLFPDLSNPAIFKREGMERLTIAEAGLREMVAGIPTDKTKVFLVEVDKVFKILDAAEQNTPWRQLAG
jgi:hypothetical protein